MATNYFRTDGWVKTAQGPAVPGAQIYICTQPANSTVLPPTPLANIFSDVNGLVPITQPIITDGFGHYDFYAAAAVYTIVVGLGGIVQQVYVDQSVGGASGTEGGGGTALILEVNGTQTVQQLLQNLTGAGTVSVASDNDGNVTITGASAVGFPSGANVVSPLPVLATSTAGLNGFTIVLKIPASYVQAFTAAGFKVGIQTTSTTGLVVAAATIGKTAPGGTAWTTNPVPFTWPVGSFAVANTLYLSNICAIAGDASHDIYIMIYFDPTSAGGSAYAAQLTSGATAGWAIYGTPTQLAGYISGNHTADANASGIQGGSLGGTSIFCIQQVVTG